MSVIFPKIPADRLPILVRIALAGAILAGSYGALHDQVSYSISTEYFTKFKFPQFTYVDFGWPDRVFAAEVGFLATWWVGLLAGWFLARAGLADMPKPVRRIHEVRAFAILLVVTPLCGMVGALLGVSMTYDTDLSAWGDLRRYLDVQDLRSFVIVAYLHAAGYLGAVLGFVVAIVYVRRIRPRLK